jgi:hypothetical protein
MYFDTSLNSLSIIDVHINLYTLIYRNYNLVIKLTKYKTDPLNKPPFISS